MELKDYIRDIDNFPIPGILFRDITPLLKDSAAFQEVVDRFAEHYRLRDIDAIVGIESRGFLLAAPLAYRLEKALIPVRKKGKLPFETYKVEHTLEYGSGSVEIHTDAIASGQRVLIVDDLLATGGTMGATIDLVETTGGLVAGLAVLVELIDLHGRDRLNGYDVFALIQF